MNIMKKTALITGGTGGIGGACVKILHDLGWEIYAPVRNIKTAQDLLTMPGVHVEEVDFTDQAKINTYCLNLTTSISELSLVVLAAGGRGPNKEFFDANFPGDSTEEKLENAIAGHWEASVETKRRLLDGLIGSFGTSLKCTFLVALGSSISTLPFEQAVEWGEIAYYKSMVGVDNTVTAVSPFFENFLVDKPGLVRTGLTKDSLKFALDDPLREKKEPLDYGLELLKKTGRI
jgi:NAD(P)-dependent dehydrogenase (short-subunit alcohol dehydrogenase family)